MKIFYAGCYICDWYQETTSELKMVVADQHDKDYHKGKPVSYFGWKLK